MDSAPGRGGGISTDGFRRARFHLEHGRRGNTTAAARSHGEVELPPIRGHLSHKRPALASLHSPAAVLLGALGVNTSEIRRRLLVDGER